MRNTEPRLVTGEVVEADEAQPIRPEDRLALRLRTLNRTGRPKGSLNKATKLGREFCQMIVESPEYQASVQRRIERDELPPIIETYILQFAFGHPSAQNDEEEPTLNFASQTMAQLVDRASTILNRIREEAVEQAKAELRDEMAKAG